MSPECIFCNLRKDAGYTVMQRCTKDIYPDADSPKTLLKPSVNDPESRMPSQEMR